ncbi:hypothetical protein Phum_PHUM139970 [Pediculus humanus corporis]|uniref:Uncharacterized protein n=1 Tax=Pediculus humanus subsp. corporis TaxID=121224 RepID=E0VET4_PEDHC|nr:uncharacterized protein Phum_PHUM139970 [Pediculus humanus corporis]EEB11890.1 hypothetical protein Phum_PHUM139970 [Pediculus humanus corporis]
MYKVLKQNGGKKFSVFFLSSKLEIINIVLSLCNSKTCNGKFVSENESKSNGENESQNQNSISSDYNLSPSIVQDLFASTIENTTLFFSENSDVFYITGNSNVDFTAAAAAIQEKEKKQTNIDSGKVGVENDEECFESVTESTVQENLLTEIVLPRSLPKPEMTSVDEILMNAAMELDPCDTDTDEESDDPEWMPKSKVSISKKICSKGFKSSSSRRGSGGCGGGNQDDRRQRKKEQNKCAATRRIEKGKGQIGRKSIRNEKRNKMPERFNARFVQS